MIIDFVGNIEGYDSEWIVGDDFVKNTFKQNVSRIENIEFYIKEAYTPLEFSSGRLMTVIF